MFFLFPFPFIMINVKPLLFTDNKRKVNLRAKAHLRVQCLNPDPYLVYEYEIFKNQQKMADCFFVNFAGLPLPVAPKMFI